MQHAQRKHFTVHCLVVSYSWLCLGELEGADSVFMRFDVFCLCSMTLFVISEGRSNKMVVLFLQPTSRWFKPKHCATTCPHIKMEITLISTNQFSMTNHLQFQSQGVMHFWNSPGHHCHFPKIMERKLSKRKGMIESLVCTVVNGQNHPHVLPEPKVPRHLFWF